MGIKNVNISPPGMGTYSFSGNLARGVGDPNDYGSTVFGIGSLQNNTSDTFTFSNAYGMRNAHGIIKLDNQDKLILQGSGWHATNNVTDVASQLAGTLYEDNNGNQLLAVGNNTNLDMNTPV